MFLYGTFLRTPFDKHSPTAIFLTCKSNHISPLLRSFQRHPTSTEKFKFLSTIHKAVPEWAPHLPLLFFPLTTENTMLSAVCASSPHHRLVSLQAEGRISVQCFLQYPSPFPLQPANPREKLFSWASQVVQWQRMLLTKQEMQVQSLGWGRSHGGGNSNPVQCACLENSMNRGAWQAAVHGVAKSQTWLGNWTHIYACCNGQVCSPAASNWCKLISAHSGVFIGRLGELKVNFASRPIM